MTEPQFSAQDVAIEPGLSAEAEQVDAALNGNAHREGTLRRLWGQYSLLLKILIGLSFAATVGVAVLFAVSIPGSMEIGAEESFVQGILGQLLFGLMIFVSALWVLSGFAGVLIIFKKGYALEAIGCAILAGGTPLLLPVIFGIIFLLLGMLVPEKAERRVASAQRDHMRQGHSQFSYYRILQVDSGADPEVIEAAYQRLQEKYRPPTSQADERNDPADEWRLAAIDEAYRVLSDPQKRAQYDRDLQEKGQVELV